MITASVLQETQAPPLEIRVFDHDLDLWLIDDRNGRPLGQPRLILGMDMVTRAVLGFSVMTGPVTTPSLVECLQHATVPKTLSGDLGGAWMPFGIPKRVWMERASWCESRQVRTFCQARGIQLTWLTPRTSQAMIERFGHSLREQFASATGYGTQARLIRARDVLPESTPVMTLPAFRGVLESYIAGSYHRTPHSTLKVSPMEAWHSLREG